MKSKFIQALLSEKEYEQFTKQYIEAFAAGKCNNRSDYIRYALGLNGNTPPQDANPDETPQTNSKEDEQISNLFANLDI